MIYKNCEGLLDETIVGMSLSRNEATLALSSGEAFTLQAPAGWDIIQLRRQGESMRPIAFTQVSLPESKAFPLRVDEYTPGVIREIFVYNIEDVIHLSLDSARRSLPGTVLVLEIQPEPIAGVHPFTWIVRFTAKNTNREHKGPGIIVFDPLHPEKSKTFTLDGKHVDQISSPSDHKQYPLDGLGESQFAGTQEVLPETSEPKWQTSVEEDANKKESVMGKKQSRNPSDSSDDSPQTTIARRKRKEGRKRERRSSQLDGMGPVG